jgi:hypothetical protein
MSHAWADVRKELDLPEPKRYAWMRDGLLVAGTLREYAQMWEGDYYSGDNDLTKELVFWDGKGRPEILLVYVKRHGMTDDDYIQYEISCNGESVHFSIDGRA